MHRKLRADALAGGSGGLGACDQGLKPRLRAGSRIPVDHVLSAGAIDLFRSQSVFGLGLFGIARFDRFPNLTNLRTHRTLGGTITQATNFVLFMTLFGTSCVWHNSF
jgi:hypothetical protein